MDDNPRLNTRLSRPLWRVLRLLATRWGLTHDQVVRQLIANAGGLPAPNSAHHDELTGQGAEPDDSRA